MCNKNVHITYLPDDLLFLNSELVNKRQLCHNTGNKYIVLIVHDKMETLQENIEKFRSFQRTMHEKYGLHLIILPFDLICYGYEQSKYLNDNLENTILIDIQEHKFVPIEEVYSIIKNSQLVVTGRYHAAVMSVQSSTPVVVKMKDIKGDFTYTYNKAHGMLDKVFENMNIDETFFLRTSWDDTLDWISENYANIIEYQRALYNSKDFSKNMRNLSSIRKNFIKENIGDLKK